ncbi:MAG: hypothetical protein Q4C01_04415 [Clostridia bacterium]|nr:hypothetical protein [Clostridia bacterium]
MVQVRSGYLYEFSGNARSSWKRIASLTEALTEDFTDCLPEGAASRVRRELAGVRESLLTTARQMRLLSTVAERAGETYELCETRNVQRGEYSRRASASAMTVNDISEISEVTRDINWN